VADGDNREAKQEGDQNDDKYGVRPGHALNDIFRDCRRVRLLPTLHEQRLAQDNLPSVTLKSSLHSCEAAQEVARGVSPGSEVDNDRARKKRKSRLPHRYGGRTQNSLVRSFAARSLLASQPGLAPWATFLRRFAADQATSAHPACITLCFRATMRRRNYGGDV
jgi:hypothetical protein